MIWFKDEKLVIRNMEDADAQVFTDEEIAQGCLEKQIPLTNVADANHSLETGDALLDIANLAKVMEETARYIRRS